MYQSLTTVSNIAGWFFDFSLNPIYKERYYVVWAQDVGELGDCKKPLRLSQKLVLDEQNPSEGPENQSLLIPFKLDKVDIQSVDLADTCSSLKGQ